MKKTELIDRMDELLAESINARPPWDLKETVAAIRNLVLTPEELSQLSGEDAMPTQANGRAAILVAGPVFGGEATRPYRHVVVKWTTGDYSSHVQYLDEIGGFEHGHYFNNTGADGFLRAVRGWQKRVAEELERRPSCLLHDFVP